MDDAIAIVLEDGPGRIERLGPGPPLAVAAPLRERRQHPLLVLLPASRGSLSSPLLRLAAARGCPPGVRLVCRPPIGSLTARLSWPPCARSGRAALVAARARFRGAVLSRRPRVAPAEPVAVASWWRALCPCRAKSILRRTTLTDCTSTCTASPSANVRPERRPTSRQLGLVEAVVVVGQRVDAHQPLDERIVDHDEHAEAGRRPRWCPRTRRRCGRAGRTRGRDRSPRAPPPSRCARRTTTSAAIFCQRGPVRRRRRPHGRLEPARRLALAPPAGT